MQLTARGRGQRGGEVGQRRRVVGAEAVEVVLQLFAVQGVERQQFLDRIDQRHAVGLDLVGRLGGLVRVFDFHQIRRAMVFEPGFDTHPGQALGDELQFAVFATGVVDFDQGAVFRQGFGIEVARVFLGSVHEEQGQGVMIGLADQFEGFGPRLFVDDHRQYLRREEGPVVDRDDVDLVRQVLARQGEAFAGGVVFDVVCFGVFARVFGEFLLVGHGAPAQ